MNEGSSNDENSSQNERGELDDAWNASTEQHAPDSDRDGPLGSLAEEVKQRRNRGAKSVDETFVEMDVGEVDAGDIWDDLLGEDSGELVVTAPRVTHEDRDVRIIPKATCHGCPHVADPPTLHCTHDGTDILSMADMDHLRVADCPMVADEDDLDATE